MAEAALPFMKKEELPPGKYEGVITDVRLEDETVDIKYTIHTREEKKLKTAFELVKILRGEKC